MLICLPIGFVAASIILRGKRYRPLRIAADFIVSIPLGVPAVLFGAGFLLTYTEGPFVLYGTRWVIVLVYVTLMLPVRDPHAARRRWSRSATATSRRRGSAGPGVVQANVKVVVPLLRSALGGAAALMFVLLTHEFAASVLVRSSTTQVMGTVLFDYWTNGSYPLVAADRPDHVVRDRHRRHRRRHHRRQQGAEQSVRSGTRRSGRRITT